MAEGYKILNVTKRSTRKRAKNSQYIPSSRESISWHRAREQQVDVGVEEGCVISRLSTKKEWQLLRGKKKIKRGTTHHSVTTSSILPPPSIWLLRRPSWGKKKIPPFQKLQDDYLTKCLSLLRSVLRGKRQKSCNSNLPENG